MPRRVFDFKCPSGHVAERLVQPDTRTTVCPICSQEATKILSSCNFTLNGNDPGFPTAYEKHGQYLTQKAIKAQGKQV